MRCKTPVVKACEETSRSGSGDSPSSNRRMPLRMGDRVDQQVEFVEQTDGQQLTNDGDGSDHRDIRRARLVLQRGGGVDEVAAPATAC